MKSFIIEVNERDETTIMEVLHRFAVSVQPLIRKQQKKPTQTKEIKPKTIAHFLEITKKLSTWQEQDIQKIIDAHEQLNQLQPQTW